MIEMMGIIERFLGCIKKDASSPCWEWVGPKFVQGYGRFCFNNRAVKAHRFSWEYHNKMTIPHGMVICHECDNKSCVNPEHLRADTQASNIRDAVSRQRWKPNYGALNGRTLLNDSLVAEIRSSKETQTAIAKKYSISHTHVSRIIRGESWNQIQR